MAEEKKFNEEGVAVVNSAEDIEKVKEEIKDAVIEEHGVSEETSKLYNELLKEVQMPVGMEDADFKLGINELDIRKLNKRNKEQMAFRQGVLTNVLLKNMSTSLVDIIRLLMVIADKLGVPDIIKATDDIIEKTAKQREELKGFVKEPNKDA